MKDTKWVRITDNKPIYPGSKRYWYKIGQEFEVRNYRYNPTEYYELVNWDGKNSRNFWILKRQAVEIEDKFELPEDLFKL
jgi:hypothetical protein